MKTIRLSSLLAIFLLTIAAFAADPKPTDAAARVEEMQRLASGLKPQSGEIVLRGGIAKVTLPASLRYLDPKDTTTVLTKLWGNPGGFETLGMLVPAGFDPLGEGDDSWAVIVTFEEDGYVKDGDAASIDYTKLLDQLKERTREGNKERVKEGYPSVELVGWATPPRYDASTKKLFWAKELKFGNSADHQLNYNFRLLGRRGVLVLNAVADMSQLKLIESSTPAILGAVNFQEGHRYADFTEGTDKVATYGLAALIVGGVAAKAGLLKGLWIAILALKKFIIIALVALGGLIKKFWNTLRGRQTSTSPFAAPQTVPAPAPTTSAPTDSAPPPPPADPAPPPA